MTTLRQRLIAEKTVIGVIVLNTVALIVASYVDPDLGHIPTPARTTTLRWAMNVDYICVVYFLIEITVKVRESGWQKFWSSGWNRFDFSVVLLSAPVLLRPIVDVHGLSFFLVLRLGRLFRLFRVMKFIPNREHLYAGMNRALRASVGVFLALLLINVVLSLGATQLFGRIAPEYFGTPAISSYSLFRIFTIEGWYEIPDLIASRAHPAIGVVARIYFVSSVMIGGILGISLANAVFVDEMTRDNNDELIRRVDVLTKTVERLANQLDARATETPTAGAAPSSQSAPLSTSDGKTTGGPT